MHHLEFVTQKTTRVETSAPMQGSFDYLLVALHGQGHLAPYFIKQFEPIMAENVLIVVPEAQSRYYLNGYSGRVGATWMTKEQRLVDINDYVLYLESLMNEIEQKVEIKKSKTLFGFSQGAATASRLLNERNLGFDNLTLWAGVFPPDLHFEGQTFSTKLKTQVVMGTKDEFVNETRLQENLQMIKGMEVNPEIIRFEGGHEIPKNELVKWWAELTA